MKIKTNELGGAALDWAVATIAKAGVTGIASDGKLRSMPDKPFGEPTVYSPSTNWAQGGPIIERERIATEWSALWGCWLARDLRHAGCSFNGPTPLISAMRCYVASKLGDEIDIPEELA